MSSGKVVTLKEVSERGEAGDVWMVIHDRVYDLNKFLDEHPGGEEVLRDMAGKVATDQFEDVGHSTDAREMMQQYEVGELAQEDRQASKSNVSGAESGPLMWLPPLGAALLVAFLYRYYLA